MTRSETGPLVKLEQPVHFIGIGGIGMSALARLLLARGLAVGGSSDRKTPMTDNLVREGARVAIGHAAENLDGAETVVVSSAIAGDNAELVSARARGLRVVGRGELLAALMNPRSGIAVGGTHGKTTTTAMIAAIFEDAGLDPTVVVGGELMTTGLNARAGDGEWFVAESDESDGSFLELRPRIAVVTNIENDHVASDGEFRALVASFATFLDGLGAGATAVIGNDDRHAAAMAATPRAAKTVTFGFGSADVAARSVRYAGFGATFEVEIAGKRVGEAALRVPGAINVGNALAAIATATCAGVGFDAVASGLARFAGVRRRFEFVARTPRMTVVDDYAHHPTAVEATIATARAYWDGPVWVALQPHRYTRTRYLGGDFALALRGADRVLLTPVYAASEPALPGVDASTIGAPLAEMGGSVAYVDSVDALPDVLLDDAPDGALVLALGAGTITDAAHRLGALLSDARGAARA